jgi:hypothetical protein
MNKKHRKKRWYLAFIIQYFEYADKRSQKEYSVWENLVLINADSPDHAYEKAISLGQMVEEEVTINGERGYSRFKGLSDLVPIYDEIEDGAELAFKELELSKTELEELNVPKEDLTVFNEAWFKKYCQ